MKTTRTLGEVKKTLNLVKKHLEWHHCLSLQQHIWPATDVAYNAAYSVYYTQREVSARLWNVSI